LKVGIFRFFLSQILIFVIHAEHIFSIFCVSITAATFPVRGAEGKRKFNRNFLFIQNSKMPIIEKVQNSEIVNFFRALTLRAHIKGICLCARKWGRKEEKTARREQKAYLWCEKTEDPTLL
jgi:hypothetical protein